MNICNEDKELQHGAQKATLDVQLIISGIDEINDTVRFSRGMKVGSE